MEITNNWEKIVWIRIIISICQILIINSWINKIAIPLIKMINKWIWTMMISAVSKLVIYKVQGFKK
jgi:hypothetical protein